MHRVYINEDGFLFSNAHQVSPQSRETLWNYQNIFLKPVFRKCQKLKRQRKIGQIMHLQYFFFSLYLLVHVGTRCRTHASKLSHREPSTNKPWTYQCDHQDFAKMSWRNSQKNIIASMHLLQLRELRNKNLPINKVPPPRFLNLSFRVLHLQRPCCRHSHPPVCTYAYIRKI